eukprot:366426-Chlamydomonas_euryale.AAC.22
MIWAEAKPLGFRKGETPETTNNVTWHVTDLRSRVLAGSLLQADQRIPLGQKFAEARRRKAAARGIALLNRAMEHGARLRHHAALAGIIVAQHRWCGARRAARHVGRKAIAVAHQRREFSMRSCHRLHCGRLDIPQQPQVDVTAVALRHEQQEGMRWPSAPVRKVNHGPSRGAGSRARILGGWHIGALERECALEREHALERELVLERECAPERECALEREHVLEMELVLEREHGRAKAPKGSLSWLRASS